MKIYLIPGLGFTDQIFTKLALTETDIHSLNWIEPLKDESFGQYAKRLAHEIPDDSDDIILIGHSLGGMVSQEIACFKRIKKIILISSIKSRDELPFHFKIIQPLRLYHFFTKAWTIKTVKFWGKQQDYESDEEQALFKEMVGKQSNLYLRWALKILSNWKEPAIPSATSLTQIHGNRDKTFPIKKIKQPHHVIPTGGHFMIYKHAPTLSNIINSSLKK